MSLKKNSISTHPYLNKIQLSQCTDTNAFVANAFWWMFAQMLLNFYDDDNYEDVENDEIFANWLQHWCDTVALTHIHSERQWLEFGDTFHFRLKVISGVSVSVLCVCICFWLCYADVCGTVEKYYRSCPA